MRAASREDAEAHIHEIEIRIDHQRYFVPLETAYPEQTDDRMYEIDYQVRVPRGWGVMVNAAEATADVSMLDGPLGIDLTNGDAQFDRLLGDVFATLINGDLRGDVTLAPEGT